jgi:hypothetical protein
MLQVAHLINRQRIDDIPPNYQLQLPPADHAPGDALLRANYVITTQKQGLTAGGTSGGGGGGAQPMEEGTGEGDEGEEAPPRTARRGEQNLKVIMGQR